jgi:hypothetical protein
MTTQFFKTKQEYLDFRYAWAWAVIQPQSKKTYIPHDEIVKITTQPLSATELKTLGFTLTYNDRYFIRKNSGRHREFGWVQGHNHVLFNIITGKPLHNGFTKGTHKGYNGFFEAICVLKSFVRDAKEYKRIIADERETRSIIQSLKKKLIPASEAELRKLRYKDVHKEQVYRRVREFLKPYCGTVSINDIAAIDAELLDSVLLFKEGF